MLSFNAVPRALAGLRDRELVEPIKSSIINGLSDVEPEVKTTVVAAT
jgi:hypothetical protein